MGIPLAVVTIAAVTIAAVCTMFVPIAAASSVMIVMTAVGIRKCGENQGGCDQSAALKNAVV